jgi:hypothetical protein
LLSAAPFLPQGNYGPADIATALSNFFAAGVAAYGMTGAITVTYNTVQQAFVITSTVTVPASFTITFSTPDLSSAKGNPPLSVTQRFALMIGLQDYISTLGGTSIMNFSVPGSYTLESAQLGGSKYVELRTNSCVNQLAMDPTGQQVLLIMPLGPLGTVSTYERNDGDIPKRTIRGEQLNNMQISLFDEWGIPFYLAKNANIHVELRFWPCS